MDLRSIPVGVRRCKSGKWHMAQDLIAQTIEAMGIKELDTIKVETDEIDTVYKGVFRGFVKDSILLGALKIPCKKVTSIEGNGCTAII